MGRIIIGLILLALGGAMTIKAHWMYENFGAVAFAEKYLGSSGGTRLFYKLIGIFFIFIGFLAVFNLYGDFMAWILSPLLRASGVPEE